MFCHFKMIKQKKFSNALHYSVVIQQVNLIKENT